jgi:hypothetical protein
LPARRGRAAIGNRRLPGRRRRVPQPTQRPPCPGPLAALVFSTPGRCAPSSRCPQASSASGPLRPRGGRGGGCCREESLSRSASRAAHWNSPAAPMRRSCAQISSAVPGRVYSPDLRLQRYRWHAPLRGHCSSSTAVLRSNAPAFLATAQHLRRHLAPGKTPLSSSRLFACCFVTYLVLFYHRI